jgi:adenylosuccinate synthase
MSATALVGAQWGSEGKGVVAAAIAPWFRAAVRTGGSNAGHTFVHRGVKHVARGIPCAWINPYCDLILGAGAVIDRELLAEEAKSIPPDRLIYVDRNAAIVPPGAHEAEQGMVSTIGSTAEGVGFTRIAKIRRDPESFLLAKDQALWRHPFRVADTVRLLSEHLAMGNEIMLEGTQGSHLSLHHGDWPYVTSNDTNAAQLAADAGIAPSHVEHVLLVARSYPIRVGGNSGPMGVEVDWSEIPGRPEPERTTVTKRVRRIAHWDDETFARAVTLNNPCGVVLTFADYLDPELSGETDPELIMQSEPVARLVGGITHDHRIPVIAAGTGGPGFALANLGRCSHGRDWLGQIHSQ